MKIMFICTGNICRSAMAHGMLDKMIKDGIRKDISVYSCGIYAQNNDEPTFYAIEVMKEYDVDLTKHRATNIYNSNIKEMDLILTATVQHKNEVAEMYPNTKNKIFTIKEYVKYDREHHDTLNIRDPWGYDLEEYRYCAAEIYECLDKLIKNELN